MPMWGRIPTVAATSMIWSCILSAMRGGDVIHSEDLAGSTVTGTSFKLMKEGVSGMFSSSVDVDPTLSHICVSASGPDKVGWVYLLANCVAKEGGNITHSKMIRLGQEFIILMHVSVSPEKLRTMVSKINRNSDLAPLNIRTSFLTKRETGNYEAAKTGLRIHCVGEDRPGMLAAVAQKVSEKKLSVENITTEIRMDSSGTRQFVINCDCTATHRMSKENLDEIYNDFVVLKDELKFDIVDVRVHLD